MNYRPEQKTLCLWDTWMFADPDGQRMHLFFLANKPNEQWQWAGHAVSSDLLHWEELPSILLRRPEDTYDVGEGLGTGMVFAAPNGEFMMSFTAHLDKGNQKISFLHSKDLMHWEKRWPEPAFEADSKYYARCGDYNICEPPAFRDAYIHRVGDHYEALIGAHAAHGPIALRGCIARYKSTDPTLKTWQALPPLIGPGVSTLMEVPEHFQIGNKHYVLWSTGYWLGAACDTPQRRQCFGTFYAMSDSYEGPYTVPANNMLIGASQGTHSYVGRTILWKGERILYHHHWWPQPSSGLPKKLVQNADGTLSTCYYAGVEKIHSGALTLPLNQAKSQCDYISMGEWTSPSATTLIGTTDGGGSVGIVPVEAGDFHLRCKVTPISGTRFGITARDLGHPKHRPEGVSKEFKAIGVAGDVRYGQWFCGCVEHSWTSRIEPGEVIAQSPRIGQTYQLDVIVRDIYFEVYIDGVWAFTRIMNNPAPTGGIGFFVEDGSAKFEAIQAWTLDPMLHPFVKE